MRRPKKLADSPARRAGFEDAAGIASEGRVELVHWFPCPLPLSVSRGSGASWTARSSTPLQRPLHKLSSLTEWNDFRKLRGCQIRMSNVSNETAERRELSGSFPV